MAGDSPAMRARSSSGLREADRINKCFPLGGGRASGGGEPERSNQSDEQRGANQRYVSHLVPLRPRSGALAQQRRLKTRRGDPALCAGFVRFSRATKSGPRLPTSFDQRVILPLISAVKRQDMVNAAYLNRVNYW